MLTVNQNELDLFCRRRRRSSVAEKKEDLPSMTNVRWWNKRMHSVREVFMLFRRHHGQTANSKESNGRISRRMNLPTPPPFQQQRRQTTNAKTTLNVLIRFLQIQDL
jgi:hypothetical protein